MSEKKFTLPQLIITFTKKIINILFTIINHCKKNFEIYSLVVAIVSICLAFLAFSQSNKSFNIAQETASSTQLAVQIANEELQLFKSEIKKQEDPFFDFKYSLEKKVFIVDAPEDIKIEYVEWFLPAFDRQEYIIGVSMKNNFDTDMMQISNSNNLNVEEIQKYLLERVLFENKNLSEEQAKSWVKCSIFSLENYDVPVMVDVIYTKRGENKNNYSTFFFRIFSILSENPKIIGPMDMTNSELYERFVQEVREYAKYFQNQNGKKWLNKDDDYYNKIINEKIDCDVNLWGTGIYFFQGKKFK